MPSNPLDDIYCDCIDWKPNIMFYKIAYVVNWGRFYPYDGGRKPFNFCPWCSKPIKYER